MTSRELFRFGPFELDPDAEELKRAGLVLRLPRQPFRILLMLVRRAGETVTREEIQSAIWGNETYVDFEQGINSAIRQIRFHLGDNAEAPRYIRTLPRRGYVFIAGVERIAQPRHPEEPRHAEEPRNRGGGVPRRASLPRGLVVVLTALLLPLVMARGPSVPDGNARTIAVKPFRVIGPPPRGVDAGIFAAELQAALAILPRRHVHLVDPGRRSGIAIEGTIQQVAGSTRVIVTAVDPGAKTQLWSETYERAPERRAGMAIDVAYRVMGEVARRYLPPPRHEPLLRSRVSPAALAAYRKARLERSRSQQERDWAAARELYMAATTHEPRFAEAWSGLADIWIERALHDTSSAEAAQVAKVCARRALALQPENAEARSTIGILALQHDYDFAAAEEAFRRATADDPEYVDPQFNLAIALIARGQFDEALRAFTIARELDPRAFALHPLPAMIHLYARRYDDALAVYHDILAVKPEAPHPPFGILSVYIAQRNWDRATAMALSLADDPRAPAPARPATLHTFRAAYRRLEPVIRRLHQQKTFDDYHVATYYAQLGDRDQAMNYLDQAVRTRTPTVSFILVDPRLDAVRSDPRFHALLARTKVGRPARESVVTALRRKLE